MVRFFVAFLLLLAILFGAELTPWAQTYFVTPWTYWLARLSAGIVKIFDPHVLAYGKILQAADGRFGVAIEAGCNGVEPTIVLVGAVLSFPASWKRRMLGLAIGVIAVQGLNVVRVITLFYLGQWNFSVFEFAHQYVWQALIMLDVLIVWLLWVRTVPRGIPAVTA